MSAHPGAHGATCCFGLAIETIALGHTYGRSGAPVLCDVNLGLEFGRITALWGPSGSGKSTLLSLLGLLMAPTAGSVTVAGHSAWTSPRATRRMRSSLFAWVLQNSACLEARTAVDNVAMGVLAEGASRPDAVQKATAALQTVGLAERARSRAVDLSGGELQRMTVARALTQNKPIVLADEPTGQLDASSSATVADAFRELARAGRCVVVATHDYTVADRCDLVVAVGTKPVKT